jgi:NAD(P)-dependent dehydrogenase (short-subunit alcohol dehydrogenase family)
MERRLRGRTIVITGASSGIGRATAHAFAREGARLVLAARSADVLDEVVGECRELGGDAFSVPTDVADRDAVLALAAQAGRLGGGVVDIWVNNAGVSAFGRFLDVPVDAHEQVIRVNLFGYLYGAHAVLPYFDRQGSGVLINVISMAGYAPTPLASSYSASKFGNRGLFETIRTERGGASEDIHICDLHPAFVDTPVLEHTANYAGKEINPVPPVIPVDRVAAKIVALAKRPRPWTAMGAAFPLSTLFHGLAPGLFRWSIGKAARTYLRLVPDVPKTDAALGGASPASHDTQGGLRSANTKTLGVAVAAGAALIGAGLLIRRGMRS